MPDRAHWGPVRQHAEGARPEPAPLPLSPSSCCASCARHRRWDARGPLHGKLWERFCEQGQTFGQKLRAKEGQPSEISARMPKARNEAIFDRITHDGYDNWNRSGHLLYRTGGGVFPAMMTSKSSRTNSLATSGNRSILPAAPRYSTKMFVPST